MKRFFLFGLLIIAAIGLPVTVVHAQPAQQPSLEPGCSPEMWNYLQDQADATRARNKAYEREILNRQQSTLYLTCYDQAMAMSAKLGLIFSDDINPAPPPADTLVFPAVAYADWGAAHPTLAMDLNTVVNPEFNNWLDAPVAAPALFNFLPQWLETTPVALVNELTTVATAQEATIALIAAFMGTDAIQSGLYNNGPLGIMAINGLVNGLPYTPLQGLPQQNMMYSQLLSQLMIQQGAIMTTGPDARTHVMTPLIQALVQAIGAVTDTCTRADDLWDKLDPAYVTTDAGVFYPPEGQYYPFSPYYTLKDFLTINPAPSTSPPPYPDTPPNGQPPPLNTPDFMEELGNATDSAALKQALNDIGSNTSDPQDIQNSQAPLGKAGNSPLWPAPPVFFPKQSGQAYTAQDVINQM